MTSATKTRVRRLDGKVAFVTGAARGMGRSHAVRLAEEGAHIIAIDICHNVDTANTALADRNALDETAGRVEALGSRIVIAEADVRDQNALDSAVATGVAALGPIDIVCANAAITSFGRAWELSEDEWRNVIDVNLTGTWHTIKAAVPGMIAAGRGGSIIMINSVNGLRGGASLSHYVASKHGAVGLMRSLAAEVGPYGIRVNTVHPGMVDTEMAVNEASLRRYFPDTPEATKDDLGALMVNRTALRTAWLDPVDISNAVVWLASDEARYVTGATIPVDAGLLVK